MKCKTNVSLAKIKNNTCMCKIETNQLNQNKRGGFFGGARSVEIFRILNEILYVFANPFCILELYETNGK